MIIFCIFESGSLIFMTDIWEYICTSKSIKSLEISYHVLVSIFVWDPLK